MNISFVCIARTAAGRHELSRRGREAIKYGQSIFGESTDHSFESESVFAFNADRMNGTWTVPTWLETKNGIFGFSQPPLPIHTVVSADSWHGEVERRVLKHEFDQFAMNHFGFRISPADRVEVWTDIVGFGRCYIVQNEDFVAFSNHIGVLSFFTDGVTIDDEAVGKFAVFGWFAGDSTPFNEVRRVPSATLMSVEPDGKISTRKYSAASDLVGQRDQAVDFEPTINQSRILAKNLDNLSVRTPTIYLSGGQDSRMTAGLWLSGGSSANVVTLGTLEPEVQIAEQLLQLLASTIDLEKQGVLHRVRHPSPSGVTMDIEDRLERAFEMWDGDAAPTNIKSNVKVPSGSAALAIGGVNGEITHGYYYSKPGAIELISGLEHPLRRMERVYGGTLPTDFSKVTLREFLDSEYDASIASGQPGLASLDLFYLREKLRRWSNQTLNSTSPILLGTPAYIRAAFDLTVQEKVDKVAPKSIAKMAVPAWDGIGYYKASVGESKVANKKGLRTWLIDKDYLYDRLGTPEIWDRFLRRETIDKYLGMVETGDAGGTHEAAFNRAIWIDYLPKHTARLNRLRSAVESGAVR